MEEKSRGRSQGRTAPITIADDIAAAPGFLELLTALASGEARALPSPPPGRPEAALVPPQRRRVLVCEGGACNAAGATAIWAHLRNVQMRRNLRIEGPGTMTAKSTCLGPCALAPVDKVTVDVLTYGHALRSADGGSSATTSPRRAA